MCKLTNKHARSHAHTEVDFSLQFVLTDYAGFFYVSNVKGIIINTEQCFDSSFHKTETIWTISRKLQFQFYNALGFAAQFHMIFPDSNKVILARGGWEQVLLRVSPAVGSKYTLNLSWILKSFQKDERMIQVLKIDALLFNRRILPRPLNKHSLEVTIGHSHECQYWYIFFWPYISHLWAIIEGIASFNQC